MLAVRSFCTILFSNPSCCGPSECFYLCVSLLLITWPKSLLAAVPPKFVGVCLQKRRISFYATLAFVSFFFFRFPKACTITVRKLSYLCHLCHHFLHLIKINKIKWFYYITSLLNNTKLRHIFGGCELMRNAKSRLFVNMCCRIMYDEAFRMSACSPGSVHPCLSGTPFLCLHTLFCKGICYSSGTSQRKLPLSKYITGYAHWKISRIILASSLSFSRNPDWKSFYSSNVALSKELLSILSLLWSAALFIIDFHSDYPSHSDKS